MMRPTTPTKVGLGYFPVRSPLLRESRLISTPPGTEMVQFPGSRLPVLCVQTGMTGHHASRVTPFGNRRIAGCVLLPVAFRSLPRPSSPGGSKASTVDSSLLDHMSLSRRSRFTLYLPLESLHRRTVSRSPTAQSDSKISCVLHSLPYVCKRTMSRDFCVTTCDSLDAIAVLSVSG